MPELEVVTRVAPRAPMVHLEHLEHLMRVAKDEVEFVAARNKREAYWRYKAGMYSLEHAKMLMCKGDTTVECEAWGGED